MMPRTDDDERDPQGSPSKSGRAVRRSAQPGRESNNGNPTPSERDRNYTYAGTDIRKRSVG
jgi:hypothetical protein